jgi:hypothetical protein
MGDSRDFNLDRELADVEHGHDQQGGAELPCSWEMIWWSAREVVAGGEGKKAWVPLSSETPGCTVRLVRRGERGRAAASYWLRGAAGYVSETRCHAVDARARRLQRERARSVTCSIE